MSVASLTLATPSPSTVNQQKSVALVGMPGGGKSTVGRHLAKRLGWVFIDSDTLIEKRIACPIKQFFEREGEARFRDVEAEVISELSATRESVLATGGGSVVREANRRALHDACHVVYLHSTPEELFRRLRHDTQRPLLQVSDPQGRLRQLYVDRDPLYREAAHFVVETGRPSVPSLVNMLLMQLELGGVIDPTTVPPSIGTTSDKA